MKLLKNATIIPLVGSPSSFTGGIFTSDGQFIEDSICERGRQPELQKSDDHLSGAYIYGGCLFGHFGHFILESLSRLYTIRQCKLYPILFIDENDTNFNFLKSILESLGINNEIIRVKIPTSVEKLIYSPPGCTLVPLCITDDQINALKYFYYPKNYNTSSKKIWLSRSKWGVGKIINELAIEKILEKLGFHIIHPENLSIQKQVGLISTADIVAGFDGSQFYTLLFATEITSKFYIFNRRPSIPEAIPYVLKKRNVAFELYNFDVEYVCGEDAWSIYYHSDPAKIIEILGYL